MLEESIDVGGRSHRVIWLKATVKGSKKEDMLIVQLRVPGLIEPPTFYVDPSDVRGVGQLGPGDEATGEVMAFLVGERPDDEKLIVQVSGEAVSYGPKLVVPLGLAAA